MFEQFSPDNKTVLNENISYTGSGNELALLMFKNLALTILTFGIYAAWGRTNTRRYLWGKVSFLGDRATYTGTGKELFKGWLLVGGVFILVATVVNVIGRINPFLVVLMLPLYVYVYALAIYGGSRYRLSRTTWRETAFTMERTKASTQLFIWTIVKYVLLMVLTLGICAPIFQNEVRRFLVNRAGFGTAKFHYSGTNSEFFKLFYINLFLTFITFGFYGPWMMLNLTKYKLKYSNLNNSIYFDLNLKGSQVFVYALVSYFATIFTLGLALPWIINWGYSLFFNAIHVTGEIDFNEVGNVVSEGSAVGDILAVEYDLDFGI